MPPSTAQHLPAQQRQLAAYGPSSSRTSNSRPITHGLKLTHQLNISQPCCPLSCCAGYMPCPYNANNNGYTWCQCPQLGPPFGLCVADSYYCSYYCQYAPSWIFTAIAKGAMLCPIDPAQIDPYKPDVVFPGWVSNWTFSSSSSSGNRVCCSRAQQLQWQSLQHVQLERATTAPPVWSQHAAVIGSTILISSLTL